MMRVLGTIFAGLLGLAFGSFLNVCVSRWPEGESIVLPASHCRNCGRTLRWWENIPLLSWIALRGKCRTCGAWISVRYVLVEAIVGALWAWIAWSSLGIFAESSSAVSSSPGFLLDTFARAAFCFLLVGLAALDAEHLWLPDLLTLPGIAAGFLLHLAKAALGPAQGNPIVSSLLGAAAGAALIFVIRSAYWLLRHREGIGLGDAKLMGMLGAWLGLSGALLAFVIGVILGTIAALVLLAVPASERNGETWAASRLPLGTFLCLGGIVSALWGQPILAAYLRWSGF